MHHPAGAPTEPNKTVEPTDAPAGAVRPPSEPHVIVLFGATGDLARRKLLPGLLPLAAAGLLPEHRVVGVAAVDLATRGSEHSRVKPVANSPGQT